MNLPGWLANATGAARFAGPSGVANIGDLFQAAGHSMLQHYRGQGGKFAAGGQAGDKPGVSPMLAGLGMPIEGSTLPMTQDVVLSPEERRALTARLNTGPAWGSLGQLSASGQRLF